MEWTNELTTEFLILYKKEPALWNIYLPEYKNKADAHEAWKRIKEKLKDGSVPIKEIKKKRDNLMSTFRRQHKKVTDSMENGSTTIFKPEWPFYSLMVTYLKDVYRPRKFKLPRIDTDEEEEEHFTEHDESLQDLKTRKRSAKKAQLNDYNESQRNDDDYYYQNDYQDYPETDTCSLYCNLLCTKLRGLKENIRDIAMMEIDRLIYNLKQQETNPQAQYLIPPIVQPEFCHSSVPFLPTNYPKPMKQETNSSESPQKIQVPVSPGDFSTNSQCSPNRSCVTPTPRSKSPRIKQNSILEESDSPIL